MGPFQEATHNLPLYTRWMEELNMSVHMSQFVYMYVCVGERERECVCAYWAHLHVQTFMCAQVHCLRVFSPFFKFLYSYHL